MILGVKKETCKGDNNPMKKVITFVLIIFILVSFTSVYAMEAIELEEQNTTSRLIEEQEKVQSELDEYIAKYDDNRAYGIAAFVLKLIQIYSIPVCFLGIACRSNCTICYWYKEIRL